MPTGTDDTTPTPEPTPDTGTPVDTTPVDTTPTDSGAATPDTGAGTPETGGNTTPAPSPGPAPAPAPTPTPPTPDPKLVEMTPEQKLTVREAARRDKLISRRPIPTVHHYVGMRTAEMQTLDLVEPWINATSQELVESGEADNITDVGIQPTAAGWLGWVKYNTSKVPAHG